MISSKEKLRIRYEMSCGCGVEEANIIVERGVEYSDEDYMKMLREQWGEPASKILWIGTRIPLR